MFITQFQNEWKQDITEETLPIRVNKKSVLLLREDPKAGKKLTVISRNPTALKVEERGPTDNLPAGTRRFEVTALQDAEEVEVQAVADASGTQVAAYLEYVVLNSQESGAYYRGKVIEIAKHLVGCHYLMGAAGARPDQQNGMPGRRGSVYMYDPSRHKGATPDDLMHSVATCDILKFHTCAGRAWKLNPPGVMIADPRTKLTEEQLAKETEDLSYRTVYKQGVRKGIILAERCEGIRHFDCIGFINYCLSIAMGGDVQWGISGTKGSKNNGYANQMKTITDKNDDQPGDILIYHGEEEKITLTDKKGGTREKTVILNATHIAFSLGHGKGRVHASDTEYGVITDTSLGNPQRRVRHPKLA
jgi:hypothetical protein